MTYADRLSDTAIVEALRTILERDQFDDWLPDPLYGEDLRQRLGQPALIASLMRRAAPSPAVIEGFSLPRVSASGLRAVALPAGVRVQAHAAAVRIAARLRAALPRDRVVGFRFLERERRFSLPGEGIGDLSQVLGLRVLFDNRRAAVTDVAGFSETARWDRLSALLLQLGGDSEDVAFVGQCYGRGPGLPSGDDAWAFLLNFYLHPVDAALIARGVDFYRVRDEYVTFEPAAAAAVQQLLQAQGFRSRVTGLQGDIVMENLEDACSEAVSNQGAGDDGRPEVDIDVMTTEAFTIKASAECDPDNGSILSDSQELRIDTVPNLTSDQAVARLRKALDGRADAIHLAPLLRLIWPARRGAVLRLKATDGGAPQAYVRAVAAAKPKLAALGARAVTAETAWLGHVAGVLLSDLGALDAATAQGLLAQARSPAAILKGAAARAALARCGGAPAAAVLAPGFPNAAHPVLRRWSGLTAYYLARRGAPSPLDQWMAACRALEPTLAERLTAAKGLPA